MPSIVIVGAGISGLSIAYRLQQALPSADISILEQNARPGGAIWTEERNGFRIEIGANGFLDTKPSTVALCRDLGLSDQLVHASEAAARNRYLFVEGKLKRLPNSVGSFLGTDLLGWRGKLSLLWERFRGRRHDLADESIDAFARRRAGREVAEVFADALVTGIHAGDPALLSMRAAFPAIVELEEKHGSVMRGMAAMARARRKEAQARGQPDERSGKMWSFRQGLRLLIETLAARLKRPPVYGVGIRRIERDAAEWVVRGDGQDIWRADAVVLTCPAYRQADILSDLDAELATGVASIPYNRIAVVALGYRQSDVPIKVDGFGYVAPQRTRRDLLGVQWCSSIFPERAPPGMVLLRAMCGGWHRPEIVDWPDDRLFAAVRTELRLAMQIETDPVMHHIIRWDRAIPQYHVGHLERVAQIERRVAQYPGLILAGNAFHGVAMNDCTEQAERIAARLAKLSR
jgi:protoporphyrinogen/coproporphyrinogen III oxidase